MPSRIICLTSTENSLWKDPCAQSNFLDRRLGNRKKSLSLLIRCVHNWQTFRIELGHSVRSDAKRLVRKGDNEWFLHEITYSQRRPLLISPSSTFGSRHIVEHLGSREKSLDVSNCVNDRIADACFS